MDQTCDWRSICETAYQIWVWLFKHPKKRVQDSPVWRILNFNSLDSYLCPMFQEETIYRGCPVGCPGNLPDKVVMEASLLEFLTPITIEMTGTEECFKEAYLFHMIHNRGNDTLDRLVNKLEKHTYKSAAGFVASNIRKVIRIRWPDSEVLIGGKNGNH